VKGDKKTETSFTIYIEDPACDSPTGEMGGKGEKKFSMKQVLAGSDVTKVISPWEIKASSKACPFTIKWANQAGPNAKMDALVTFAADTRTVTFKGSTNDANGKALMGKYTYEAKWYNQKGTHVSGATTTVDVVLDETKCLTANWKPVFNTENKATVVNPTGFKVDAGVVGSTPQKVDLGALKADSNTAHCKFEWSNKLTSGQPVSGIYTGTYTGNVFSITKVEAKAPAYGKVTVVHEGTSLDGKKVLSYTSDLLVSDSVKCEDAKWYTQSSQTDVQYITGGRSLNGQQIPPLKVDAGAN